MREIKISITYLKSEKLKEINIMQRLITFDKNYILYPNSKMNYILGDYR